MLCRMCIWTRWPVGSCKIGARRTAQKHKKHQSLGISLYECDIPLLVVIMMHSYIFNFWPAGLMDKASASGAGDSRFESWADHWWRERNSGEVGEWPSARMNELCLLPTRPSRDPNSGCQVEDWPCARMNELRWLPPISSRDPKSGCLETKQT